MNSIDSIMDRLRVMPRDEVDTVRKRITAYLAFPTWGTGGAVERQEPDALRVYDTIRREMQSQGLLSEAVPYRRLQNRSDFAAKAKFLMEFVRKQHTDRRVQDGILAIGIQLLVEHFRDMAEDGYIEGTVSLAMICRNISKVPARLDRAFPGYGGAGLLHLLVKPGR